MAAIKQGKSEIVFEWIIILILTAICLIVIYPLILIVSSSFSDPLAVLAGDVSLLPVRPNLNIYKMIFRNNEIWSSYRNTIIYTAAGTAVNLIMTALGAYPLSRRDFYGNGFFAGVFVFTMFFGGGMIPGYLLVKDLKLLNTMWALILPGAVGTWNMIIMRTFFQGSIPMEMQEAAFIDGANDLGVFWRIVIPLSSPIIAVMALFYGVGHWNSWFSALLYISDRKKYPLQIILREILIQSNTQEMSGGAITDQEMIGDSIKYATMVVATLPILCLYPFLQKYFVKGVMIGAIKG
mgnify:CR=1 FL=1